MNNELFNSYKIFNVYSKSIGSIIIISFNINQYLTNFSTCDAAIEKCIITMFDADSTELIDVIDTTSNVKTQNTYWVEKSFLNMKEPTQI